MFSTATAASLSLSLSLSLSASNGNRSPSICSFPSPSLISPPFLPFPNPNPTFPLYSPTRMILPCPHFSFLVLAHSWQKGVGLLTKLLESDDVAVAAVARPPSLSEGLELDVVDVVPFCVGSVAEIGMFLAAARCGAVHNPSLAVNCRPVPLNGTGRSRPRLPPTRPLTMHLSMSMLTSRHPASPVRATPAADEK